MHATRSGFRGGLAARARRAGAAWALTLTSAAIGLSCGAGGCAPPPPSSKTPITQRKTQDIRDASEEQARGAVVAENPVPTSTDPITMAGNVYVQAISQVSALSIQHALNLYHAMNERYPASHEEFMNEIVRANNIALPALPPNKKYAYNVERHELQVLVYPSAEAANAPGGAAAPAPGAAPGAAPAGDPGPGGGANLPGGLRLPGGLGTGS